MQPVKIKRYFLAALILVLFVSVKPVHAKPVNEIKIGIMGTMKMLMGEHQWMGAELAAEEINKAGGITVAGKTYAINLVKVDDNNMLSISDAISAIERAITLNKVDFLIGGMRSEAILAQQEIMAEHKVIWLNAVSASLELTRRIARDYDKYKYWFRTSCLNAKYVGAIIFANIEMVAQKVRDELGIDVPRVAVIAEKVMWPDPIIAAAKKDFPKMGLEFIGAWRPSSHAIDTSAELLAIKRAGAHIILTIGSGPVDTIWSKQYGELQIPAAMVGVNSDAGRKEFWADSNGNCNYLLISTIIANLSNDNFFEKYSKKYNTDPIGPALTYEAVYILKEAIERAGTLKTDSLIEALEKTCYHSFRGKISFYPKGHDTPHDLMWGPDYVTGFGLQWQDGKLALVWPVGEPVLGDKRWKGIRYDEETVEYKLPPRMIKYWKAKKK